MALMKWREREGDQESEFRSALFSDMRHSLILQNQRVTTIFPTWAFDSI